MLYGGFYIHELLGYFSVPSSAQFRLISVEHVTYGLVQCEPCSFPIRKTVRKSIRNTRMHWGIVIDGMHFINVIYYYYYYYW